MTETVRQFIARVDRLEARDKGDSPSVTFQMPREDMIALRDELKHAVFVERVQDRVFEMLSDTDMPKEKETVAQILASGDDWFVGAVPTSCKITYNDGLASDGGEG